MKFKRFIYVWDIHGSEFLEEFIYNYDDGKTKFYFLGDYSDRWFYLYKNYLIMKKLVEEWKLEFVLWNHDFFHMFWEWLKKGKIQSKIQKEIVKQWKVLTDYELLQWYNLALKDSNGWEQNDRGILLDAIDRWIILDTEEEQKDYLEKINKEIADFLWEHWQLYIIDDRNNFLIHGGIPILPSQELVWGIIKDKWMIYGIDYIKEIAKGIKTFDLELLYRIDSPVDVDYEYKVISEMERFGNIKNRNYSIYEFVSKRLVSCIWYNNWLYEGDLIRNILQKELNEKWINKIILWHWQNKTYDFEYKKWSKQNIYFENNNILRLDRSHVLVKKFWFPLWNLWYAILNEKNELIETNDFPWKSSL